MEYDDLIKNIKATLIKAAAEGKRKGIAAGIEKAIEVVNKKVDELKESLVNELQALMNADAIDGESTKEKEK